MRRLLSLGWMMLFALQAVAVERQERNFNADWRLWVGDLPEASTPTFDDSRWQQVTLPYAFNGDEAFRKDIVDLTDTICWYRKRFTLSADEVQGKVFVEFEGVRQAADVYLNGHSLGFSENGVMAFGMDLTPFAQVGENVLAVRCDNSWTYRSRAHDSRYQWNDKNFNANYGGIPKNVRLHVTDRLYQTLPLYSNLGTTGTYIYATDYDIVGRRAVVHVESEVQNDDVRARTFSLRAQVFDAEGQEVASFASHPVTLQAGERTHVQTQQSLDNLHFWSWGYGYLYTVRTALVEEGKSGDLVTTRTGFRKTEFGAGKIRLNDRVLMVHGYAQRTSNEWPGVGLSVPAWLSDYSNRLMVESGGNLVRWMHVTPWKQDIESCDRVGLLQAMPAGDAEKDVEGPRWEQRKELMRDAIIYNRNNPSILFYECGNESISREHLTRMVVALSAVGRCWTSTKRNMVARCSISTRVRNTRCGRWNIVVTRVSVSIGTGSVILSIRRATVRCIVANLPPTTTTTWTSWPSRWYVVGTTIGGNVLVRGPVSRRAVSRLSFPIPTPTIVASPITAPAE